jgi:hypothetical protein
MCRRSGARRWLAHQHGGNCKAAEKECEQQEDVGEGHHHALAMRYLHELFQGHGLRVAAVVAIAVRTFLAAYKVR